MNTVIPKTYIIDSILLSVIVLCVGIICSADESSAAWNMSGVSDNGVVNGEGNWKSSTSRAGILNSIFCESGVISI